jgi:hypothetical protein
MVTAWEGTQVPMYVYSLVPGVAAPDGGATRQLQRHVAVGPRGGEEFVDAGPRELDTRLGQGVPRVQQPHVPQNPIEFPVEVGKVLHQSALQRTKFSEN